MGLGIWLQELGLHGWLGCRLAWLKGGFWDIGLLKFEGTGLHATSSPLLKELEGSPASSGFIKLLRLLS